MPKHTPDSSSIQLELPFEQWRDIPGYEGTYQVSNLGNVQSSHPRLKTKNRMLAPRYTWGYAYVQLFKNKRGRSFRIHRLVYEVFIGAIPNEMVINHKNGDRADNRLSNLECITQAQNVRHAIDCLGAETGHKGEKHRDARLTEKDVREIRLLAERGMTARELAARYSITKNHTRHIIRRLKWSHVE